MVGRLLQAGLPDCRHYRVALFYVLFSFVLFINCLVIFDFFVGLVAERFAVSAFAALLLF